MVTWVSGSLTAKRQRAGALQTLAEDPTPLELREAAWTAVALYRFAVEVLGLVCLKPEHAT